MLYCVYINQAGLVTLNPVKCDNPEPCHRKFKDDTGKYIIDIDSPQITIKNGSILYWTDIKAEANSFIRGFLASEERFKQLCSISEFKP